MSRVKIAMYSFLISASVSALTLITIVLLPDQGPGRPAAREIGIYPAGPSAVIYRYSVGGRVSEVLLRGREDVESYRSYLRRYADLEVPSAGD